LAELAVRLTPSSDSVALLRRRLLASDFHHSAGAPDRARALLEPLLGDATAGGDRADVLERLARLSRTMDEYLDVCERGLLAAAGDDGRLSRMNWLLAGTWPRGGGSRHALRYSKRALLHADRSGDRRLRAAATARVALMETWAGRSTPGLLARGVALERSVDRLWFYESPRLVRALLRLYQGRLDEARSAFEAALDETAAAGDEVGSVELRGRLVELELRAGGWQRASVHQSIADELGEQIGLEHPGARRCSGRRSSRRISATSTRPARPLNAAPSFGGQPARDLSAAQPRRARLPRARAESGRRRRLPPAFRSTGCSSSTWHSCRFPSARTHWRR
jgi:hypothetical protein